jgi:monothiol glutaredoxin
MTFSPESELSAEEVQTRVDEAIENNDVVVFMKGNRLMPQCGYSKRAVELVGKYVDEFETVDVLPALPEFRAALESHSGWETTASSSAAPTSSPNWTSAANSKRRCRPESIRRRVTPPQSPGSSRLSPAQGKRIAHINPGDQP